MIPEGWHIRSARPGAGPGAGKRATARHCVARGTIRDYAERKSGPGDIGLIVEVSDSSLAFTRVYATNLYGPAGIPA